MNPKGLYLLLAGAWLFGALAWLPTACADDIPAANTAPAPSSADIATWIAELDDNRYLVRERATQQLLEAGAAALDPLLAVANGGNPEPADRAVWIMRRLARSADNELALAALERLVQLRDRPLLVEKAETELGERSLLACQQRLTELGAEVTVQVGQFDMATVAPLMHVQLGEKWRGTTDDLRCLAQLRQQAHFRLDGRAIDDEAVKQFGEKEKLSYLHLRWTTVTPEAVDALKERHPNALVQMRNEALMGIQADAGRNHVGGVMVLGVEPPAATAGIAPNDVIAKINGHPLPDFDRLTARIAQHRPGETVDVEVIRGEERKQLSVTLGSWEERDGVAPPH